MGLAGQALDPSSEMQVFSLNPLGILFFCYQYMTTAYSSGKPLRLWHFQKAVRRGQFFKCAMTVVGLMGRPQEIS